ncbi:A1 cistron-splicing factor AAR2, partial [Lecanoromycetidae sp. Uapishka_2]
MSNPQPNPPTATALLLDLPPNILCGIDLLSFTTTTQFHGIKDIPPGWHFIFTSETTSLSIRDGFWFHIPESQERGQPPLVVYQWHPASGFLRPCKGPETYRERLHGLWERNLSPYRQSASKEVKAESGDWKALTKHITPGLLSHLTQSSEWRITSASCAREDRDEIPGLTAEEVGEELELGTLGIDLKRTWREGAVGRERTEAAVDRSWALSDVAKRWRAEHENEGEEFGGGGDVVLGQMEACFLMVLTVANFSCLEEWKRCVGLVLTCKRAVREREGWFGQFLVLLRKQLERCEDVEGGLFDMSDDGGGLLKGLLKGFRRTVAQVFGEGEGEDVKEEMEALEAFLKGEYGWELGDEFVRKGMVQLADGEMVEMETEEMEGEDERGEYAPVIVDLENT